jgi:hypothetical protein
MKRKNKNRSVLELLQAIEKDAAARSEIARTSHFWFFLLFLSHYCSHGFAPFHKELFELSEQGHPVQVVMAFRGSGKSTIMNLSYVLWSILGKPEKKFVVIVSKGKDQAKLQFENIKRELKSNERLNYDLGPLNEEQEEWGTYSLELPKLGVKIISVSSGKSIRGMRYGIRRPDLIILDDVEDSESVRTERSRRNVYEWFAHEILPAGDTGTQIVVLGNLLHEESFLMKLKEDIDQKRLKGVFRAYPLLDDSGKCLWPQKFKNEKALKILSESIADEDSWNREYLLTIRPLEVTHVPYYGEGDLLYRTYLKGKKEVSKRRTTPKHAGYLRGYAFTRPRVESERKVELVLIGT